MNSSIVDTKEVLFDEICEFLECAIHNILYIRQVYPSNLFKKVKIYNVPVFKARHPALVQYIKNILESVKPLFTKSLVDKLCLVICKDYKERQPLEQYSFSLKLFKDYQPCTRASLETFLRSFLLKINIADSSFEPIPVESEGKPTPVSFYILVHTSGDLDSQAQRSLQAELENPWVSADFEEKELFKNAEVVPFKTISTQSFQLQLNVEQISAGKDK